VAVPVEREAHRGVPEAPAVRGNQDPEEAGQQIVRKFATLRGLGAADLLAGLNRIKVMATVTDGDLSAANHDDDVREPI